MFLPSWSVLICSLSVLIINQHEWISHPLGEKPIYAYDQDPSSKSLQRCLTLDWPVSSTCTHRPVQQHCSLFLSHTYVGGLHVLCGICECTQKYGHTHIHMYISGLTTGLYVTPSSSGAIFLIWRLSREYHFQGEISNCWARGKTVP